MADETKLCSNCKRDISASNFVMHEMHCRRHIVLCQHCGEPVNRVEIEQHFNDLHAKIPCEKCQHMVPKPDMAKHLAQDCARKLAKCEFCELSLPKNEMEAHLEYCGSRTECCALCRQYIMLKDKLRHESSRCTYPEAARPQPADPFSMEVLQQFMTNATLGNRSYTGATFKTDKLPANRKSELNAQRAKNMMIPEVPDDRLNPVPPDADYDTMLALQLAHEDWFLDGSIENDRDSIVYMPNYLTESSPGLNDFTGFHDNRNDQWSFLTPLQSLETTTSNSQTTQYDEEGMSIPCEFCESDVPLNSYIVHMESCPLALERRAADLNNEQHSVQQTTGKATIPVINNLRPSNSPPKYHTYLADYDDDVMLPCEFCQEIFPSDFIIQHQSVCQADGVTTPRAASPAKVHNNLIPQVPSSQMSFNSSVKSPPKRQKNPVEIDFVGRDGSSDLTNGDRSNVRLQKVHQSSSNKYSPAYNRFDDALTRPPRRSTRQEILGGVDGLEPKKESRSAQRTRASLNQLLQGDSSHELVGLGDHRMELEAMGEHNIQKAEPKERKTKIDSRTVARRLDETRQKPPQGSPGRSSLSQHSLNPPRNRQRADHVFSPELRLKRNNSPPPKKR